MKAEIFGYQGGTFSKEELMEARIKEIPLTLDFAIPGGCLNDCIFCGYKDTQTGNKLSIDEIKAVIQQFSELGGKSVKILGEGEPLLREDILEIYRDIRRAGLQPVLFTCGDVLGDDKLAIGIHNISGEKIIKEFSNLETTVMLKYEAKHEDNIVQTEGYSAKRNLALERLIERGFNQYQPTHLGFGIVILSLNYNDIPHNYGWAVENNVYPLLCPLMPIGKAGNPQYRQKIGITSEKMVDLASRLHVAASDKGIRLEHPADFPGGCPVISQELVFTSATLAIFMFVNLKKKSEM